MTDTLTFDGLGRIAFQGWPKTPRLFRDCVITEKIDGTNSAVRIVALDEFVDAGDLSLFSDPNLISNVVSENRLYGVWAQSRKRLITPGKQTDNFGFAQWVQANARTLVEDLGPGLHFGEWWGYRIGRGYDLPEGDRRFSLFNVTRYRDVAFNTPGVDIVPVLFEGQFDTYDIEAAMDELCMFGSKAAYGFMRPEGVVVYHSASNQVFKALIENDELPKSIALSVADGKVPA